MIRIRPVCSYVGAGLLCCGLFVAHTSAQEAPAQPSVDFRFAPITQADVGGVFVLRANLLDSPRWLGVDAAPADDALRAQLALPEGQGLVVLSVEKGGPADEAGLEPHDVILTVAGQPVGTREELRIHLAAKQDEAVPVTVLRGGKRITMDVTPKSGHQIFANFVNNSKFRIGVTTAEADATLRSQLRLGEKGGLVVTAVQPDSPAAKAGIQPHDLLYEFGGKPLATVKDLQTQMEELGATTVKMWLLRGGEAMALEVTPAERSSLIIPTFSTVENELIQFDVIGVPTNLAEIEYDLAQHQPPKDVNQQLADLTELVKKLTEKVDSLERAVRETPGQNQQ